MTEEQKDNTNNDFPDSSDNSSFLPEEDSLNPDSQKINPNNISSQGAKKDCYSHPNIIINTPENKDAEATEVAREGNTIARQANRISRIGLFASIFAAAFTLGALYFAWDANKTTQNALKDAREKDIRSEDRERRLDSSNYTRDTINTGLTKKSLVTQEIAMKNSDSVNKKTIAVAEKSLETQITAFNENRKSFEEENRPLMQIVNIRVDSMELGKTPLIRFDLVNLGKFPGKILDFKTTGKFDAPAIEKGFDTVKPIQTNYSNTSLGNGAIISGTVPFNGKAKEKGIELYKTKKYNFYLFIQFTYQNFVTKKPYYSYSIWRIVYDFPKESMVTIRNHDN